MGIKKYKIFIAEDAFEWIKFHIFHLKSFLGEDCVEINYAFSSAEGLRKISEKVDYTYDLVISDLEMEELSEEKYAGINFIKRARGFLPCKNAKFLIVSGSHDIKEVASLLGVDFLPKYSLSSNPSLINYKIEEMLKT